MTEKLHITGGEALARMLLAHDAGPMFGMGGFQLLPFYDAARRLGLNHNLINDERCAAFAADAYAKTSGRVGLCDATLGPGATNLVTGLAEAYNAGSPIVAIIGDTHRDHSWKNMTQEARQIEILTPVAKSVIRIERINRIPALVRHAFSMATSGRPGPVILDIPEDVAHEEYEFDASDFWAPENTRRAPAVRCRPNRDDIERAAALLEGAKRPLMLCGGGVHLSQASEEVEALAVAAGIPVAHTMTGKGAIACSHPLSAGLFGRYDRIANKLLEEADCLLVVGCKLGEIATKRYALPIAEKPLIHLDISPEEFHRTTAPTISLWGDIREALCDLCDALAPRQDKQSDARADYLNEIPQRMEQWRESVKEKLHSNETPVHMARMLTEINALLPENGCLIADGGFAAHWASLLFDTKVSGRTFIPDRGFASIGYGLPGAMGAALAAPDAQVVSITGDGGFNMTIGELETALRMNLAFTLIVVNNAASGYVKALQHLMYGEGAYQASDLKEMNYAAIAEAMGCRGLRVDNPAQIQDALREAFTVRDRPTIIDMIVTRDPGQMLPAVDSRIKKMKKGDRIA